MLLLTIETSCDETAAAVVRDGRTVLSSIVASQVKDHAVYGGVVPEIASRKHLESIPVVIDEALRTASVSLDAIEGVAVTQGPGLAGALLVGTAVAKAIAFARRLPIVGVNHIEGHLSAIFLEREVAFPFVALAVSGGHTHLYRVDGIGRYTTLGQTRDDAAGEAFDKVAKLLGLSYPGGVEIDRLAAEGDPTRIPFPRPLLHDGSFNFSFSGLKTAVLNYVRKNPVQGDGQQLRDLCASFQRAACDVLVTKTLLAAETEGIGRIVVAGGVACNSALRRDMAREAADRGIELAIPSPSLCSDNAAMLAVPGDFYLSRGISDGLSLDALVNWPLDTIRTRLES
ncbi:tRNA (adenosine(37)-N6)-threonylcarbamoyltransferase complex transferase subunit TsaD [Geobacter hydrogenophilus]|uniref:tRNA N6-adenosine threonylcarbamoyltransferase n=1 Tax=Geobacter hydrogenophilus TaxID=40983 RepID=A0A9W6L9P3_9BACT|nr:tRNA (adenosine(37)-N6)-threonylcarbamoyltransferase complex transferase subunit TsaD [Geobacter hydrogenophilus]MBT0894907.1 tRNA (adenosine(37)-N6)-threonylcarbamoyltransferase complex transferase subunit TsaD [Geobacter hydrogenophilus]GLI36688.1 tRNA N6-adenosine threonylcarbamoyltransferase [Geobacter hydrogenophilus]